MLVLTLGLVGMHQLAAAAHGSDHQADRGAVAVHDAAGHGHVHGAGDTCDGDDVSGSAPSCGEMGDVCVATLDDSWALAEPPAGPPSTVVERSCSVRAVAGGLLVRKPPDRFCLQVSRT